MSVDLDLVCDNQVFGYSQQHDTVVIVAAANIDVVDIDIIDAVDGDAFDADVNDAAVDTAHISAYSR